MANNVDLIIIGAGPGGMEANKLALRQGLTPLVIEADKVGGTCLNRGCIPTKALCRSAEVADLVANASKFGLAPSAGGDIRLQYPAVAARKDSIVDELREGARMGFAKSRFVKGVARFAGPNTVEVNDEEYTAPKIIIATGSEPSRLPIEGAELTMTSDDLLHLTRLPESLCIIGGGVIGMEIACIMHSFGVPVTVIEYCPEILPNFDREIAKRLRSLLSRKGIKFVVNAAVTKVAKGDEDGLVVSYTAKGKEASVTTSDVLMATGRRAVLPEGCEEVGIKVSKRGIEVDKESFETSVPGVYAVGDVNGLMMLAHVASAQAATVMGHKMDLSTVPAVAFTSPETAYAGVTEEFCKAEGIDYSVSKSLYRANGKAMAMGEPDGFVKLIKEKETDKILGGHIIGAHASDLIHEIALAVSKGMTAGELTDVIHAHPSLSEIVMEAAAQ